MKLHWFALSGSRAKERLVGCVSNILESSLTQSHRQASFALAAAGGRASREGCRRGGGQASRGGQRG
eukprot:11021478-Alexandrium_andersonii.AAC.1